MAKFNSIGPKSFRGEPPPGGYIEPGAINEYKARSMIEEYRGLAIVFAFLGLALAVYFVKSVLAAPKPAPPPPQSVYIEMVPEKPAGSGAPSGAPSGTPAR